MYTFCTCVRGLRGTKAVLKSRDLIVYEVSCVQQDFADINDLPQHESDGGLRKCGSLM